MAWIPTDKLFDRIEQTPDGCWIWKGPIEQGYGRVSKQPEGQLVHRVVYMRLAGEIPEGWTLDHLCRNRACCNPGHLEPKTIKDNVMAGEGACAENALKTHCKHGHEFTPENTGQHKSGGRYCIQCSRDAAKRQRVKNHKGKRLDTANAPRWRVVSKGA